MPSCSMGRYAALDLLPTACGCNCRAQVYAVFRRTMGPGPRRHIIQVPISLGVVVSALMTLQWGPDALVRLLVPEVEVVEDGDEPLYCLNHTCPRYHVTSGGNIHLDGRRKGVQESYCDVCGSRFLGNRSVCRLIWTVVRRDLRQLHTPYAAPRRASPSGSTSSDWSVGNCCELIRRLRSSETFAGSAIPRTRNLRALQLGLLSIVQEYVALKRNC